MEKLQRLAQSDWLAIGKTKEYYSAISDIVRDYLEQGFGVSAMERTTSELLRDLRKKSRDHLRTSSRTSRASGLMRFGQIRQVPPGRG